MKLVKLDRRHKGWSEWDYYATVVPARPREEADRVFFGWRAWCWAKWGPSKELAAFGSQDTYDDKYCSNSSWCWSWGDGNLSGRIYLRGQREATAFTLHWS